MLQEYLHKTQIAVPVIDASLTYAPSDALLHMESLKMLLQETDSAYPAAIHDPNEYLLESHALLVQHITGLLQDNSMYPVALTYLSPYPSSFPAYLLSEIPSQGPTSVPTSNHRKYTSDLPSTLPSSFTSNISSEKPTSYPPYAPSKYQRVDS